MMTVQNVPVIYSFINTVLTEQFFIIIHTSSSSLDVTPGVILEC